MKSRITKSPRSNSNLSGGYDIPNKKAHMSANGKPAEHLGKSIGIAVIITALGYAFKKGCEGYAEYIRARRENPKK